jgi:IPT/TIG domain
MVTTPISPAASTTYTYLPSPKVTAISPAVGPTAGGQTVTITGTNFDTSATTFVNIGGVAATV